MKTFMATSNLEEQRKSLCLQLQKNRRFIALALVNNEKKFPRSFTMRLITQNKAVVGIDILRIFSVSFSFLSYIKKKLERNNNAGNIKIR